MHRRQRTVFGGELGRGLEGDRGCQEESMEWLVDVGGMIDDELGGC